MGWSGVCGSQRLYFPLKCACTVGRYCTSQKGIVFTVSLLSGLRLTSMTVESKQDMFWKGHFYRRSRLLQKCIRNYSRNNTVGSRLTEKCNLWREKSKYENFLENGIYDLVSSNRRRNTQLNYSVIKFDIKRISQKSKQ